MSAFMYTVGPNFIPSPFPSRTTRTLNPIFPTTHLIIRRPLSRESVGVARFGLGQVPLPDPEDAQLIAKDLFGRIEGLVYTIADAAVKSSEAVDSAAATKQSSDWLYGITNSMETILKVLKDGLSTLHVPYAYGFAIILLTVIVKAATFPLTKKQVESAMAMQSLAPQIKAIQEKYAGDQERIQLETARLYKLAGINPLAGCLPTLATIPIWIGLYRALSNVANEGLLTEGFFWIPSLSGPTTIAARQTGSGTTWLFPFVDGHPPLGWSDTLAYLVLPVLLVVSQYVSVQIMQPPQSNDPAAKNSQAITKLLPLMIGYFSLSVPSGLSLYWFTNNILSTVQQVWLRKLGGARNPLLKQFSDDTIQKEQAQVLKSISEAETRKKVVNEKEEKPTSGPRAGERFKQLKEQEARRRQQREEEKRKAEEASAAKSSQTKGDDIKETTSTTKREDISNQNISANNSNSVVNGDNGFSLNGDNAKANKDSESPDDTEGSSGLVSDDRTKERSALSGEKNE